MIDCPRREALLHSKTAVVDGVWSKVGATNLDWRSFLHNQELNAVVLGADFGTQMRTVFQRDLEASEQITLGEWRRRGLYARAKELLGRMWRTGSSAPPYDSSHMRTRAMFLPARDGN